MQHLWREPHWDTLGEAEISLGLLNTARSRNKLWTAPPTVCACIHWPVLVCLLMFSSSDRVHCVGGKFKSAVWPRSVWTQLKLGHVHLLDFNLCSNTADLNDLNMSWSSSEAGNELIIRVRCVDSGWYVKLAGQRPWDFELPTPDL